MRSKLLGIGFGIVVVVMIFSLSKGTIWGSSKPITVSKTQNKNVVASKVSKVVAETYHPNELGRVMILEYHLIGSPEAEWRRTPENFRKDLTMLYENGYYPVPLKDYISGHLKVPAGKTPFVITFDDSSQGQFRYLKQSNQLWLTQTAPSGSWKSLKKNIPIFL